jgi:hypothetical protein
MQGLGLLLVLSIMVIYMVLRILYGASSTADLLGCRWPCS